jgi:hypothetical protein
MMRFYTYFHVILFLFLLLFRMSAALSGIELTVLGLGESYQFYDDKLKRYHGFLFASSTVPGGRQSFAVHDDDIVLLIDAYDVLLFPQVRRLHELLASSPTPVLACAESGIYPEPMVK